MKILGALVEKPLEGTKLVNMLGNYLYNNLDGAIDFKKNGGAYELNTLVLYQKFGDPTLYEMILNLDITTYTDKIRVNILEKSPDFATVGFSTFPIVTQKNIPLLYAQVWPKVCKQISKYFEDYEFLF